METTTVFHLKFKEPIDKYVNELGEAIIPLENVKNLQHIFTVDAETLDLPEFEDVEIVIFHHEDTKIAFQTDYHSDESRYFIADFHGIEFHFEGDITDSLIDTILKRTQIALLALEQRKNEVIFVEKRVNTVYLNK